MIGHLPGIFVLGPILVVGGLYLVGRWARRINKRNPS
jgi:hypothetical protein